MRNKNEIFKALSSVTQVGLTVLSPIAACLIISNYIVKKFNLPGYIIAIAVGLGAVSGFLSMIKYLIAVTKSKK
ncbi:MAG: AtpZ/AtpI family protein [Ruminococcaceae bacterium]|nr:AtpZ/AtpI family protein [Oscillospiraceae bacterium]